MCGDLLALKSARFAGEEKTSRQGTSAPLRRSLPRRDGASPAGEAQSGPLSQFAMEMSEEIKELKSMFTTSLGAPSNVAGQPTNDR